MKENVIKSYKGFDKDFKCKDFQYEVGKEYEIEGEIKCCERGFHACESPMEVFDYYDMLNSRFAEVEQSGQIDKKDDNKSTKICSSRIKIKAELNLADIINIGIEWLKDINSSSKVKADTYLNDNGGNYAKIGSSGEYSVIMCAGKNSAVKAKAGSCITLSEWVYNEEKWRTIPKCVKTEYVDGTRIKADTWYKLIDGEFTEL